MQDSVLPQGVGLRKPHISSRLTSFSLLLTSLLSSPMYTFFKMQKKVFPFSFTIMV